MNPNISVIIPVYNAERFVGYEYVGEESAYNTGVQARPTADNQVLSHALALFYICYIFSKLLGRGVFFLLFFYLSVYIHKR